MRKGVCFQWNSECADAFGNLKQCLVNSTVLAFPRFEIQFRLAVDTSSQGIGYVLYQIHEDGEQHVIRFGSKGLSKWQASYGPTKLELLGVVTSVLDCSPYIRGNHFVIECDHQALRPLFQKQLHGAIYDRWLTILQQFSFDIVYKPAQQMSGPDALSRQETFPEILHTSPEEEDPHFQYVPDKPTQIRLISPDHMVLQSLDDILNFVTPSAIPCMAVDCYDADSEDTYVVEKRTRKFQSKRQLNLHHIQAIHPVDECAHSDSHVTCIPKVQSQGSLCEHEDEKKGNLLILYRVIVSQRVNIVMCLTIQLVPLILWMTPMAAQFI